MRRSTRIAAALIVLLPAAGASADVAPEPTGMSETLALPPRAHWAWVADVILHRSALFDLDEGRFLGLVNGGYGTTMPLFPSRRAELYLPATYYSRHTRGERTDVVEIFDLATLAPLAEVVIPPKRSTSAVALAHAALSDDDRFLAVFNWTAATSLSVVDVERRRFVTEINTSGCSLVYAAGPRRFFSLCGDGSVLTLALDADGHEQARQRSEPFFDPKLDPVTEKAVRFRDQWLFVSFGSRVHPVDVSGPEIRFGEPWSLLDETDRGQSWRVGGLQHLAVHEASGRLYALMHRGGADTHKEPGEEVWIFDLASRSRSARIALVTPGIAIYGFPIEPGRRWRWPFGSLAEWLLDALVPAAVDFIQVTKDDAPLLLTASQLSGSLGLYDARDGRFLRRVQPTGFTSDVLLAPWVGKGTP